MKSKKWMELMQAHPHDDLAVAGALLDNLKGWTWRGDKALKDDLETVLTFMAAIRRLAAGAVTTP